MTPEQAALDYLHRHHVMSVATDGPLGLWAAAVFYASNLFDLYFLSAGHTRHAQNLMANPHAAATVQEDYGDWPSIQGIQLEGEVSLLAGEAREAAVTLYQQKFPFLTTDPLLQSALTKINWYCLRPQILYFIDNSRGFGHRDQIL